MVEAPGEKVFKGHRSYDLMISLQVGIRFSISRVMRKQPRGLLPDDFVDVMKVGLRHTITLFYYVMWACCAYRTACLPDDFVGVTKVG